MRQPAQRPACTTQPPQLAVIPYVPNVINVTHPEATFNRRLPVLAQRPTLLYIIALCAEEPQDFQGKQFRCHLAVWRSCQPACSCLGLHAQLHSSF